MIVGKVGMRFGEAEMVFSELGMIFGDLRTLLMIFGEMGISKMGFGEVGRGNRFKAVWPSRIFSMDYRNKKVSGLLVIGPDEIKILPFTPVA